MGTRQQPGQNACVRSVRNRAWRECLREPNAPLCQLIHRGSLDPRITITTHVVAPQRVDGNQKNILAGHLFACADPGGEEDRKSTRLNSSHRCISYAVFCLKKKKYAD